MAIFTCLRLNFKRNWMDAYKTKTKYLTRNASVCKTHSPTKCVNRQTQFGNSVISVCLPNFCVFFPLSSSTAVPLFANGHLAAKSKESFSTNCVIKTSDMFSVQVLYLLVLRQLCSCLLSIDLAEL